MSCSLCSANGKHIVSRGVRLRYILRGDESLSLLLFMASQFGRAPPGSPQLFITYDTSITKNSIHRSRLRFRLYFIWTCKNTFWQPLMPYLFNLPLLPSEWDTSGPLSSSVGLTVTKPKYLTLVLQYCTTQTVKEYEGHGWGGSVGGCFIIHYYLRIENAEGNVLIAVYLYACVRVIRISKKVLNRNAWNLVGWLVIIRGPFD